MASHLLSELMPLTFHERITQFLLFRKEFIYANMKNQIKRPGYMSNINPFIEKHSQKRFKNQFHHHHQTLGVNKRTITINKHRVHP